MTLGSFRVRQGRTWLAKELNGFMVTAAKVRLEASRVFVGFLGGNLAAARLARTFSFSAVAIRVVHLRELAFTTGLPK